MRRPVTWFIQVLGALLFAGLCIYLAFSPIDLERLWPVWFTVFLFGVLSWETRRFWRQKLYWIILVTALAFHLSALLTVRELYPSLSLISYVVFGSLEAGAIVWILFAFCG